MSLFTSFRWAYLCFSFSLSLLLFSLRLLLMWYVMLWLWILLIVFLFVFYSLNISCCTDCFCFMASTIDVEQVFFFRFARCYFMLWFPIEWGRPPWRPLLGQLSRWHIFLSQITASHLKIRHPYISSMGICRFHLRVIPIFKLVAETW